MTPLNPWFDLLGESLPQILSPARLVHFDGGEHGHDLKAAERRAEAQAARRRLRRERAEQR